MIISFLFLFVSTVTRNILTFSYIFYVFSEIPLYSTTNSRDAFILKAASSLFLFISYQTDGFDSVCH